MAKVDSKFFDQLGRSAPVVALVNAARDKIAATAVATAPAKSGDYRRGIVVRGTIRERRYVGLVVATDRKSMIIEARTGNLARAVRVAGGRGRR